MLGCKRQCFPHCWSASFPFQPIQIYGSEAERCAILIVVERFVCLLCGHFAPVEPATFWIRNDLHTSTGYCCGVTGVGKRVSPCAEPRHPFAPTHFQPFGLFLYFSFSDRKSCHKSPTMVLPPRRVRLRWWTDHAQEARATPIQLQSLGCPCIQSHHQN